MTISTAIAALNKSPIITPYYCVIRDFLLKVDAFQTGTIINKKN